MHACQCQQNKVIMHLIQQNPKYNLPSLTKSKNSMHRFSNPLTGLTYHNSAFLQTTFLQDSKEIRNNSNTAGSNKREFPSNQTYNKLTKSMMIDSVADAKERRSLQRESQLGLRGNNKSAHIAHGSQRQELYDQAQHLLEISQMMKTANRLSCKPTLTCSKLMPSRITQKLSSHSHVPGVSPRASHQISAIKNIRSAAHAHNYRFADVKITVLNAIKQAKDIQQKVITTSFGKYFNAFFINQLSGALNEEFINTMQHHINQIILNQEEQSPIDFKAYPPQLFTITSKRVLLNKLQFFQQIINNQANLLTKSNVSGSNSSGHGSNSNQSIHNVSSTLLSKSQNQYNVMPAECINALVKYYCIPCKQMRESFMADVCLLLKEEIYQRFSIDKDQDVILLDASGKEINDFLQIGFHTRQLFISKKNSAATSFKSYLALLEANNHQNAKNAWTNKLKASFRARLSPQEREDSYEESPQNYQRRMEGIKRVQMLIKLRGDKLKKWAFPAADTTPNQKSKSKSNSKSQSKSLRQTNTMLKLNQNPQMVFLHERIRQEFDALKNNCNAHAQSIPLKTILAHSLFFKKKSYQQCIKILIAAQWITADQQYLTQSQILHKTISFEQYNSLRRVISCQQDRDAFLSFIDRYLPYDQFDQMDRTALKRLLLFILPHQSSSLAVIQQIIWNWLQNGGAIANGIIRRGLMHYTYQKNRVVCYFMVSLIFGTNQTSSIQLAQQMLLQVK